MGVEQVETAVIGAGQAGLATAYHLGRRGRPCVVLEANDRVGDVWRQRFDSLRLFTPARYDALPGLPFTVPKWDFPTGRQMGDYLEAYAVAMGLPVRTGISVDSVGRDHDRYVVTSGARAWLADNVVIASGTWQRPIVPDFADDVDPSIRQLHSSEYRNPGQLQPGSVLVVGAGHSGVDIAFELAATHEVFLAGRIHGEVPFRVDGHFGRVALRVIWFAWNHVVTERTPIGRKMRPKVRHGGGPLIRVKRRDLQRAGVRHVAQRVVGVQGGSPALDDGEVVNARNVIWCTGFGKDTDWIEVPLGDDRWPSQTRGAVVSSPGLYFVGLPFLHGFYSGLVGGVTRDADHVARQIAQRTVSGSRSRHRSESPPALVEPS